MSERKTIRLRVTATAEYDANPADYDGCHMAGEEITPEEMAACDLDNAQSNGLFSVADEGDLTYTVEVVQ